MDVANILHSFTTVAVVGIKAAPFEPACYVRQSLQPRGDKIIPVQPKFQWVLGERYLPSLLEMQEPVDIMAVFHAPEHRMPHAGAALGHSR